MLIITNNRQNITPKKNENKTKQNISAGKSKSLPKLLLAKEACDTSMARVTGWGVHPLVKDTGR